MTELGISIEVKPLNPSHKYAGIFSTSLPKKILVIDENGALVKSPQSFAFQIIVFKFEHPEKVPAPIEVTELGIVNDVKPLQPEKADEPIQVTELGIVTHIKPLQP